MGTKAENTKQELADQGLVERWQELLKKYENDATLAEVEQLLRASGQDTGPSVVATPRWQYTLSCG